MLAEAPMAAGARALRLDALALPSGVYFVRLEAANRVETVRVAVQR